MDGRPYEMITEELFDNNLYVLIFILYTTNVVLGVLLSMYRWQISTELDEIGYFDFL